MWYVFIGSLIRGEPLVVLIALSIAFGFGIAIGGLFFRPKPRCHYRVAEDDELLGVILRDAQAQAREYNVECVTVWRGYFFLVRKNSDVRRMTRNFRPRPSTRVIGP
jgi:hypothetical protein